jgi:hypothetical protein
MHNRYLHSAITLTGDNNNMAYIPKHFKIQELVSSVVYQAEGDAAIVHLHDEILQIADQVREFFNVPVTINNWNSGGQFSYRGYRDSTYQDYRETDPHVMGIAIDLDVQGMDADKVRSEIIYNQAQFPLIYRMEAGVNWVHIDTKGFGEHPRNGIYLFTA